MRVEPLSAALGAEVHGLDLSRPLDDACFESLYEVFLEHLVIFVPGQRLSTEQHRELAARFGELDIPVFVPPFETPAVPGHPEIYQLVKAPDDASINIGGFWHADVTHRERPNLASLAYVREAPSVGGDTLFSNLYLAFETLSPGMRAMLEGLQAVHTGAMPYGGPSARSGALSRGHAPEAVAFEMREVEAEHVENVHPVVRRHPETGRRSLYVNRGFTSHFLGWSMAESRPLLEFLWAHAERPELTCRYQWSVGTLGIWDNRCVLHYALNDYYGERRVLHRISVNEPARPSA